jgi:hypothetical protein
VREVLRSVSFALVLGVTACAPSGSSTVAPGGDAADPREVAPSKSATEILDELEARIDAGTDTPKDRARAYEQVKAVPDDGSADYAFARAAVAGRLAENRGAKAGRLVTEAEAWALRALERDPAYRDGAAVRMLGTLYVLAPGRLVEHGDSEDGLTMLEELTEAHPEDPRNHLRVAEAYLHLGDPGPSRPSLCAALQGESALRPDDQRLLTRLVADAGGRDALGCERTP